jgi:phage shock protein C
MNERLYRSRDDRMLAGVAGGLAEIWDADPSLVRIVWALLVVVTGGLALLLYVVMAIVVPEGDAAPLDDAPPVDPRAPAAPSASDRRAARRAARVARRAERGDRGNSAGIVFGAILILIGGAFFVREWWPSIDFDVLWPLALVGLGVVVLVLGFTRDSGDGGAAT